MPAAIRSELRKLLTIRSTYGLIAFCVLLTCIFAFWAAGIRAIPESLQSENALSNQITGAVGAVWLILAIIGLLLITHEYRYNTMVYTLSASNSRAKTLLAKILVLSGVSVVLTIGFGILSPLLARIGMAIMGHELVPQTFYFQELWWRCLLYGWGYMMAGLLLGTLVRSQVAAIVLLLLTQSTIEPLLGMLLKSNSIYLPFSALNSVLSGSAQISSVKALGVFLAYMVVGWAIAFLLFLRRDAN